MTEAKIAGMSGPAALPRSNGELVFTEPWEGRAFGIAVALNEAGAYDWEAFRKRLIGEIESAGDDDGTRYYERWLASLEQVLLDGGVISEDELSEREQDIAAHDDHDHGHGHDHGHVHSTREVTT